MPDDHEEFIGANPKTCLHRVLAQGLDTSLIPYIYCFSCDTEITKEWRNGRFYIDDVANDVWVEVRKLKKP